MKFRIFPWTILTLMLGVISNSPVSGQTAQIDDYRQLQVERDRLDSQLRLLRAAASDPNNSDEEAKSGQRQVTAAERALDAVEQRLALLVPQIRVFNLEYADAVEVVNVVEALFDGESDTRIAMNEGANQLIVQAPAPAMERITKVLELLDTRNEPKHYSRSFQVEGSTLQQLREQLGTAADAGEFTENPDGSQLTVTAKTPEELEQIATLIAEIRARAKPRPHTIRVAWLVAEMPDPKPLPPNLKPVVAELEKLGVSGLSVAAQISVRTMGSFESSCKTSHGMKLDVQGEYDAGQIELGLRVVQRDEQVVSVSTVIELPEGHPVVLGMSPTPNGQSAFVVTVD